MTDAAKPTPRRRQSNPGNQLNDLTAKEWVQLTKSWFIADGKPKDITREIQLHPASFPPDMVARFIRFFTKPGDTVLDPFAGTGSVLASAFGLKRRSIGVELSETHYRNTVKRMQSLVETGAGPHPPVMHHGDARSLSRFVTDPVRFCITSPPYWNMLKTSRGNVDSVQKKRAAKGLPLDYGEHPADLGVLDDYDEYLHELVRVFQQVRNVLEVKRYLVVVLQNIRQPDGEMRPLAWEFALRMRDGWQLQQEYVWCQNQKPLGCWGYPSTYVSNVHHHYCLVFRRQ